MNKYLITALMLLLMSLAVTIPDVLYGLFNANYLAGSDGKSVAISILLVVLLSLSRLPKFNLAVLIAFALMQSTQLMYFHYYGNFYSAFDIILMTGELEDAVTGFADVLVFLWLPFLLSMALFVPAIVLYKKQQAKLATVPYLSLLFIVLLILPLFQSVKSESSQKFQPNVAHSALKNGLYSMSYFVARQSKVLAGVQNKITTYKPYEIHKTAPVGANIVVLMGESLSYMNMGMFGYERDTTPDLKQYINKPNFIYKPSISSAVSTRVSLALFFNTMYEPDNAGHLKSMDTALFKLAKESGYDTHYITTQKNAGGLSYSFSPSHIDTWKENKHLGEYESQYDDRLLMVLKDLKLDYEQPQFVTLHMRSTHAPYVDNYPKEQEVYPVEGAKYKDYLINSYDNSVLYTQKVITDIYEFFAASDKPTYIFFTSDHGELMGQGGRFGHNAVDLDIAKVPFLFFGVNLQQSEINKIDTSLGCMPNHYQISKYIAGLLGYDIHNPNEEPGSYYLNGTGVFGEAGFMQYSLSDLEKTECS